MISGLEIVPVDERGVDALRYIHQKNFGHVYHPKMYEQLATGLLSYAFFAKYENEYVGEVCVRWSIKDEHLSLYILSISVINDYRRMGIGRILLQHVIDTSIDAYQITLHTQIDNYNAQSLYTQLGFTAVQTIPHYYGRLDGLYMVRPTENPTAPTVHRHIFDILKNEFPEMIEDAYMPQPQVIRPQDVDITRILTPKLVNDILTSMNLYK